MVHQHWCYFLFSNSHFCCQKGCQVVDAVVIATRLKETLGETGRSKFASTKMKSTIG